MLEISCHGSNTKPQHVIGVATNNEPSIALERTAATDLSKFIISGKESNRIYYDETKNKVVLDLNLQTALEKTAGCVTVGPAKNKH